MPTPFRLAAIFLALGAAALPAAPSALAQAAPSYGTWGFDLTGRDLTVKPGDDFETYASGAYLKTLTIPPDQSRWGSFNLLRDLSDMRVHGILEEKAASAPAKG